MSYKEDPPKALPLDVEKQLLKVDKVIGETEVEKTIDTTVNLPIRAKKIFDVAAGVTNVRGEVREGGVLVSGMIRKQLFVVDEKDLVRHVPEEVPFQEFVRVEGARPRLKAQVRATIIDIETELSEKGRKVRQEILLDIFVKVTEKEQIEVVTGVKGGPKDLKVEKKLLKVDSVVGEDLVSEAVENTVELPITAQKIFQVVGEVRDVEAEVREDMVMVRGVVHKQIFFVDKKDLVRHVSEDVPFKVDVRIPGARKGLDAQVDVTAVVDAFELVDSPGRELWQTIVLDVFAKVTEMVQLDVVIDVKGKGIEAVKELLKVEQVVADVTEETVVESKVELPREAEKIFRILADITDVETEVLNGRVIVRAILHKQLFYVDQKGFLRHFREDVPFQMSVDVSDAEPGMNVQPRLSVVGEIDFDLVDGRVVEQKAVIEAFLKVTRTVQLEVVVDVRFKDEPVKPKRFVIVKEGDTLFKIAKREGVTLEALIAANPQIKNPDLIFPGQKVFIPSKDKKPRPPKPDPTTRVYIVQKGDTLFQIAKRFNVPLDTLIRANPQIKDPDVIFPGQKILIPQK